MAATYDINNFVIDRTIRGTMLSQTDGTVLWSINQLTNPALNCSTETEDAVDMLGTPIATFDRAKTVEFSGENAIFDLGLYAAQAGTTKEVASTEHKIVAPAFEDVEVIDTQKITLSHIPVTQVKEIHLLKADSTLGDRFVNGGEASATAFVHTASSKEITLPTSGIKAGDFIHVIYDYESEKAVSVSNNAQSFPTTGKFVMEVLGYDMCDQETQVHAYVIMPNAKLTGDYDLNFTTTGTHPFTIKCSQAYCTKGRKLVQLVIPKED